jgi:hypothetical protein
MFPFEVIVLILLLMAAIGYLLTHDDDWSGHS